MHLYASLVWPSKYSKYSSFCEMASLWEFIPVRGVRVWVKVVEVSRNAGFRPGQCPDCLRIPALSEVVDKLQAVHWRQGGVPPVEVCILHSSQNPLNKNVVSGAAHSLTVNLHSYVHKLF